jgi:hypothetical protein
MRGGRHSYAIQIGHNILYVNATAFYWMCAMLQIKDNNTIQFVACRIKSKVRAHSHLFKSNTHNSSFDAKLSWRLNKIFPDISRVSLLKITDAVHHQVNDVTMCNQPTNQPES